MNLLNILGIASAPPNGIASLQVTASVAGANNQKSLFLPLLLQFFGAGMEEQPLPANTAGASQGAQLEQASASAPLVSAPQESGPSITVTPSASTQVPVNVQPALTGTAVIFPQAFYPNLQVARTQIKSVVPRIAGTDEVDLVHEDPSVQIGTERTSLLSSDGTSHFPKVPERRAKSDPATLLQLQPFPPPLRVPALDQTFSAVKENASSEPTGEVRAPVEDPSILLPETDPNNELRSAAPIVRQASSSLPELAPQQPGSPQVSPAIFSAVTAPQSTHVDPTQSDPRLITTPAPFKEAGPAPAAATPVLQFPEPSSVLPAPSKDATETRPGIEIPQVLIAKEGVSAPAPSALSRPGSDAQVSVLVTSPKEVSPQPEAAPLSIPGLDPQPKAFFTNHPQNYTPTTSGEQLQLGDVKSMVVENKPTVMNPTTFYRMPKMPIKDLKAEESLVMEPINPNDVSREKVIASDPADTEKSSVPVEAMHVSPKSRVSPTSTETLAIEILPQPGTSRDANELDSGGSTSAPAVASQSQPNVASEMVPAKKGTAKIQAGASDVEESDDDAGTEKGVDAPTEIVNHSDHGGQIRHDTREPAPADPPTESRPGRARDGIVSERFSARDAATIPVSSRKNPATMQSARPAHASASPESDHVETVGTTTKTQGDDPQTLSAGSNLRPAETAAAINPPAFPPAGHATSVTPSSRPETADPLPPQPQGTERASLPGNLEQSILEQVSKSLIVRQGSNPPEIRITMKPESLGEVVMKVKMEGGRVSAQIDVNSTTVKTVLESNVPQLRDMMASRGIDLQRIDIVAEGQTSLGSSSGQNRSRQKSRSNEKGGIESLDEYDSLRALGYNTMELIM